MKKKALLALAVSMCLLMTGCGEKGAANTPVPSAPAQSGAPQSEAPQKIDFPKQNISIIVPYAAGGSCDLTARIMATGASKYLNNVNLVVENKEGGSGLVGATEAFSAKPDGYTLIYMPPTILTITSQMSESAFEWKQLKPIIRVMDSPLVMGVSGDSPFQSFGEWVDYCRENPGKFTFGIGSAASTGTMAFYSMIDQLDLDVEFVSFNGGAPLAAAILGDHVGAGMCNAADIKSQLEDGTMRALVNFSQTQNEAYYADIPLIKDIAPEINLNASISYGFFANENVPDEIIQVLHDGFKQAMEDPEVIEQFSNIAAFAYMDGEEYLAQLEQEYEINHGVLESQGMLNK